MAWKKTTRFLRQPAITSVVVIALAVVAATAIPSVRTRISAKLDSGATLFLFDEDTATETSGEPAKDGAQQGKNSNGFKRVVTAPVRLFARLFRNKNGNDLAMKKAKEKDIEKMKVIPLNG